jgi:hypothetical protein
MHDLPLVSAELSGTTAGANAVALASGTTGSWTSQWYEPGFTFSRLVPSWSAEAPGASFIRVRVQARTASGEETAWYSFGVWAYDDATVPRTSSDGQRDRFARVETDTLVSTPPLAAYRMRIELFRPTVEAPTPLVRSAGAVVSDPATISSPSASDATVRRVYPRAAFEHAWIGGSGGTVYVIRPATQALPERAAASTPNW